MAFDVAKGRIAASLLVLPILLLTGCGTRMPTKTRSDARTAGHTNHGRQQLVAGKKILVVHSYHPGYRWVASITEGIRAAVKGTGAQVEVFYMDTKRNTSEQWMIKSGQLAVRKMEEYKPDVVIVSDDNAQQYFARNYVGGKVPFVFTGVDADPSKYGYPAPNVTGIIERPQLAASLKLAGRFHPIKRIAVLSCNDSTSVAALGFMKEDPIDVTVVDWNLADDLDDWKAAVKRYNKSVDAIVVRSYQALKDPKTGGRVLPRAVGEWTARNATAPTIAFHDFEIRDGIFIGVVKSGFEYGYKAADYGLRILRGTPPSELPIIRADIGTKMMNRDTAGRLGVSSDPRLVHDISLTP